MKKLLMALTMALTINCISAQTAGKATFYHDKFEGRKTKSEEIFKQSRFTCASTTYKIGTRLKITNPKNGKSVECRVNDTGRLSKNHVDLSKAAFKEIGDLSQGWLKVIISKIIN